MVLISALLGKMPEKHPRFVLELRTQFASFKVDALTKQPQPFTDGAPLHGKEVPSVVFEGKKIVLSNCIE